MNFNRRTLQLSLTRRSLGRFAQAMMPSFELDPFHRLIVDHLESLLSGKIKKLAVITPPRHGKSTLGNVIVPAYVMGRNPTETIITVSYGSELSEGFGRRVRNILSDPDFHKLFPGCLLSPDSAAAYRFTTTAGGEYSAVGRGGPVTGRGASLLVLDDLLKDSSEANSDAVCRGIIEWLQHVAFTRLTPNGRVLAIATRWSERDPMGWILQQHGWTILHLPAFAEATDPLGREPSEALWPSHYPVEALEAIRSDVGSRVFQCLYQGNVAAAQGAIFKRDWFRHYATPPEKFTRIIQSWDTSFKTGKENDYSVCATLGQAQNGIYLLALYRAKMEFPELKRKVGELADVWKPQEILVEDRASGQSLVQELKLATSYPVIAVQVDRDKETRAAAVTGYFEAQKVLFPDPQSAPWVSDLEDELASFPGGRFDDQVDAISQALNRLRDSGGGLLGLVDYLKGLFEGKHKLPPSAQEILASGKTPARPVIASSRPAVEKFVCPACKSPSTVRLGGPGNIHCNMCGFDFDATSKVITSQPGQKDPSHIHRWHLVPGGWRRCDDCEKYEWIGPDQPPPTNGMSRAQYQRSRGLERFRN